MGCFRVYPPFPGGGIEASGRIAYHDENTMSGPDSPSPFRKYTAIWQPQAPREREWIDEIMGPYIAEHVTDGKHRLVLDNAILFDAFVYCYDPAYYAQFRGKNAFLVIFLDENYEGGYEIYENFRGVFRCFWSDVFRHPGIMKMPLGYCNGARALNRTVRRATERRYLWSFMGAADKSTRPDVARELAHLEPHFMFSTGPVPGVVRLAQVKGTLRTLASEEFSQVLLDTVFSPCPMGNVNIECYRAYESLECGAIPIVEKRLTLDYYRKLLGDHPMPTVRSWADARRLIRKMLRNPDDVDRLQKQCMTWWAQYKQDFSSQVGDFLAQRSSATAAAEERPTVSQIHRLPGWRLAELMRHHDARAVVRRIQRQAYRLFIERKLRVAHRPGVRLD